MTIALLFVTTTTTGSLIQLYDLTNNPGLVSLKLGHGRIQVGSHKIFHVIDTSQLEPIMLQINSIINDLKVFDLRDTIKLLNRKLETIQKIYKNIMPISRQKRGLFDGLGNMIKIITGNLDNNDLAKINNQFEKLYKQNNALITENNEQVKINHKVQDRMNRIIKELKEHQEVIVKNFIKYRQNYINDKNNTEEIAILKEIFNFNVNLDLFKDYLNNIFESIQMSKVKVISKNILTTEEIFEAMKILKNEKIIVDSYEQVIEHLEIIVFHKETKIVFVILIPTLKDTIFEHQLIEPIAKEGKVLNLFVNEALTSETETFLITGDCRQIGNNTICNKDRLRDVSSDTCYSRILRGSSGHCELIEAPSKTVIKQISSNYLIVDSLESLPITTNCGLSNRNISTATLIYFKNCTVEINHTSFTNVEYFKRDPPVIIPLNGLQITGKTVDTNITLHKLKEVHLDTRKQLVALRKQQLHTTIGTFTVIIVIAAVLVFYLLKDHICHTPNSSSKIIEPGRFDLKEGVVTDEATRSPRDSSHSTTEDHIRHLQQQQQHLAKSLASLESQHEQQH